MRERNTIQSIISMVVAAIMLSVFVSGAALPVTNPYSITKEYKSISSSNQEEAADSQTIVNELGLSAYVVAAFSFDFQQYSFDLPLGLNFNFKLKPLIAASFEIPHFFFSYFHKVFGNLIAANAP